MDKLRTKLINDVRTSMEAADNEICFISPQGPHYDVIFEAAILTVLDWIRDAELPSFPISALDENGSYLAQSLDRKIWHATIDAFKAQITEKGNG